MKFFRKYGTRSNEIRRAKREFYSRLALIGFVLLFFATMILVTRLSPRLATAEEKKLPEVGNIGDPLANPTLIKMRADVADLERQFNDLRRTSRVEMADLAVLEQAIDLQNQILRYRGSEIAPLQDVDKLESLQALLDEYMGEFLRAQSDRLEAEANSAWEMNRQDEALEKLTLATNLQRQINSDHPRSNYRNASRLRQLETRVMGWTTRPMAQQIDFLKDQASILSRAGDYDEALQSIGEAMERQNELNRNYRESRYASIFRSRELEDLERNIRLSRELSAVRGLVETAREELNNDRAAQSLDRLEEAEVLLLRVQAEFPGDRDRYQSLQMQVQITRDTAAGADLARRITALDTEITESLRSKNLRALRNSISELRRLVVEKRRNFPRSEHLAGIDFERIEYLHDNRETLPAIIDVVYAGLLPIPGHPGLQLFSSEVPQALYTRLMGNNPSQNVSPQLPVDSITWEEARRFNAYMSWILAYPVRLPQKQEFLDALGVLARESSPDQVWAAENTDRTTQQTLASQPNSFGFYDLLGNVAEWMDAAAPGATPERVLAIGGSARDSRMRLQTIPEEARSPTERNRFIGFRFVVEFPRNE